MKLISYQPWRSFFMIFSGWMLAGALPRFTKLVEPLPHFKNGLFIIDVAITSAWITNLIIIFMIMYKNVKIRRENEG